MHNIIIGAITRCRSDREITTKTMDMLRMMESLQRNAANLYDVVVQPNTTTYCMAIDAFGISAYQKTKRSHNRNQRHKHDDNAGNDPFKDIDKAESILKYMHDLYDVGTNDVVPNTVAYNTLISAYSRFSSLRYPDVPLHAEEVLRRMIDMSTKEGHIECTPDVRSYNGVIRCWANSKRNNAGIRGTWWLRRMQNEVNDIVPNTESYNSVILAFHYIDNAEEAEKLLEELLELEKENDELRPNSETYSLVIRSWLNQVQNVPYSDVTYGCESAFKWLKILIEREEAGHELTSSPDLFIKVLNVIESATYKYNRDDSLLEVALQTFSLLKDSRHFKDAMSYKYLLQTGLNVLSKPSRSKGRQKFLRTIIGSCCDDGFVSKQFVLALSKRCFRPNAIEDEVYEISQDFFSDWPLPSDWYRNVAEDFVPMKRDCANFFKAR